MFHDTWITGKTIPIPHAWDTLADLPCHYAIRKPGIKKRAIRLTNIVPSQPEVCAKIVKHYISRPDLLRDEAGDLPFGLRFKGSSKVYLIDGHHRLQAARRRGDQRFPIEINEYPFTVDKAFYRCTLFEWAANQTKKESRLSTLPSVPKWSHIPATRPAIPQGHPATV